MSDLIRRSDVLDLLYGIFDKYKMSTDKNTSIGKSFGTDVFEEIRNMPTAYSVDKVVEELEKEAERWEDSGKEYKDKCEIAVGRGLRNSIKIVKQGVVSDYVCEWKLDGDNLTTCCGDYFNLYDNCTDKFKFCPTCGKNIKVV